MSFLQKRCVHERGQFPLGVESSFSATKVSVGKVKKFPTSLPSKNLKWSDQLVFCRKVLLDESNRMEHPLAEKRKASLSIHRAFNELQFRHLPLDLTVVDGPSEASFHRILVFLHPSRKLLKLWQITGRDPLEPGVKPMSFFLADHLHEIGNQIIGPFERWAGLAEGGQILLFNLVQTLLVADKQPDGSVGSKLAEAIRIEGSLNMSLLEGLDMAIDRSI